MVVSRKDQANKKLHAFSAQIACEAATSIRTVASLTRERECCNIYSKSLEEPLRRSYRTANLSNAVFAISQSMFMFIVSLMFWYGAKGLSRLEYGTTAFFVCLFVSDVIILSRSSH